MTVFEEWCVTARGCGCVCWVWMWTVYQDIHYLVHLFSCARTFYLFLLSKMQTIMTCAYDGVAVVVENKMGV